MSRVKIVSVLQGGCIHFDPLQRNFGYLFIYSRFSRYLFLIVDIHVSLFYTPLIKKETQINDF